jgi:hypothetical protein
MNPTEVRRQQIHHKEKTSWQARKQHLLRLPKPLLGGHRKTGHTWSLQNRP